MPRPQEIAADARALYGPLDQRPSAQEAGDGALWVDPGAGHALYQVQSGNWVTISPGESGGTVTSVGLSAPSPLSSSGGPISTSGTLALAWATGQTQNRVLASPDGSSGAVALRALVAADLPSLPASQLTSGQVATARGGTGVDASAAGDGTLLIGNGAGLSLAALTAGSNVTVTNSAGGISIAASGGTLPPLLTFTAPPAVNTWTWVNQGSATAVLGTAGLYLTAPAASGSNYRSLVRATGSTPWALTAAIIPVSLGQANNTAALILRESSSGKEEHLYLGAAGSGPTQAVIGLQRWTNPTTWSADVNKGILPAGLGAVLWVQVSDDGTNRTWSISADGQNYLQISQVARTTFLTANQAGFSVDVENASFACGVTLASWSGIS